MEITYKDTKDFTEKQVEQLFLSINWLSGRYPQRLLKALRNSQTVITAWADNQLVGLVRVIDDGEMTAYLHYLLVLPDCQGMGIATQLLYMVKQKYKDYLYLNVMPEESKNVAFYEKHGFKMMEDGVAMQIVHL